MRKLILALCGVLVLGLLVTHFGTMAAGAQAVAPEVAILSGTLANGQVIPLPVYPDGVTAQESECSWTVSPRFLHHPTSGSPNVLRCDTVGRTVRIYWCLQPNCEEVPSIERYYGEVNYLVIAVRGASPTIGQLKTFGSLKAAYR